MLPAIAAAHVPTRVPADWLGWAIIIIIGFFVLRWVLWLLGLGK